MSSIPPEESSFAHRHIGASDDDLMKMTKALGFDSPEELALKAVPQNIIDLAPMDLPNPATEAQALNELKTMMAQNDLAKSLMGMGYYGTHTPSVIARNILENPSWYTQYTPYQAEIAQGRLEALLNFQTMITELTALDIANASLLDEATAVSEAVTMAFHMKQKDQSNQVFVDDKLFPQSLAVLQTRAEPLGIELVLFSPKKGLPAGEKPPFAVLLQFPDLHGEYTHLDSLTPLIKTQGSQLIVAADITALTLLTPPGEWGADIVVGSTQRFGIPMGYGGPHAGYLAAKDSYLRKMPGRIVGVSKDQHGKKAYRLALATREQHIRRDKATSNICTAQVLLAIMASMYAVYHGPEGLKTIAKRIQSLTDALREHLKAHGRLESGVSFGTLAIASEASEAERTRFYQAGYHIGTPDPKTILLSLDETTTWDDVQAIAQVLTGKTLKAAPREPQIPPPWERKSAFLTHPVFHRYHSETQMMRYIKMLERRDLSLTHSMIPLGSCTMKLNAASELMPLSWPSVNQLHPFVPPEHAQGYAQMLRQLEQWLCTITGFEGVSLQPNSGAQGEYAGLLAIRRYFLDRGQPERTVCLIPTSAHGTNPASAVMAGMRVVPIRCDDKGNIDLEDLKTKAQKHQHELSTMMITYPSTHGVFEEGIVEICQIVHEFGGQVYMDGANLQAQIGLCYAGKFGPDVCHMNLHKTFCIPHGGGGPGMGPIAVKSHLIKHLPEHPVVPMGIGAQSLGSVSAAPYGSPSILPISWMYIRMMGASALKKATVSAIVAANYIAHRLTPAYNVVYRGQSNLVAHECIIDLKPIKKASGIDEADIAKRLMDYGFHAPTVSWPVSHSMMIEPTESESLEEIERFCEAMLAIAQEVEKVSSGVWPREQNPIKNAPHTQQMVTQESWDYPYSRQEAAFPLPWVEENKFWPFVGRIDQAGGDRHLICTCPPMDSY